MSGPIAFVYDDRMRDYELSPKHPLNPVRLYLTEQLMSGIGLFERPGIRRVAPVPASREEVERFHTAAYLNHVERQQQERPGSTLDSGDTPVFPGALEACLLVTGASLRAARLVWSGEVPHAQQIGGGLHHAHRDRASGFCIVNDVVVAIKDLQRQGAKRIVYIDIDAHHGDGVMYALYDEPILDIDFHEDGRYLFPGTGFPDERGKGAGEGYKVNVPMPPHAGDAIFAMAWDTLVPPLVRRYQPEIILLQCGVDGHAGDPLTHLAYTMPSYRHAIESLHALAHELCGGKLVVFGGGGYHPAHVAQVWTEALARLDGATLPKTLPAGWRREANAVLDRLEIDDFFKEPDPPLMNRIEQNMGRIVRELAADLGLD